MPGQLNEEFFVAKIKSQPIESWNPAAAATPLIAHTVGIEIDLSLNIKLEHISNIYWGFLDAWISFKSCPAENAGPYAFKIIIFIIDIFTLACSVAEYF